MSNPRGHRNGRPTNQGGNSWGNQGTSQQQSGNQSQQRPPNFADSEAFGPPLGGRARPNRAQVAQARGQPHPVSQPPANNQATWGQSKNTSVVGSQPATQQAAPSAWGKPNAWSTASTTSQASVPKPEPKAPPTQTAAPSAWGKPNAWSTASTPSQASVSKPEPIAPPTQTAAPSAWGKPNAWSTASTPSPPPSAQSNTQGNARNRSEKANSESSSTAPSTPEKSDENTSGATARGNIHGEYEHPELRKKIKTKPDTVIRKQGVYDSKSHQRVFVARSNYFKLSSKSEINIFQYRVDFSPEVDCTKKRTTILNDLKKKIGVFLYDRGSVIYTLQKFYENGPKHQIVTRIHEVGRDTEVAVNFTQTTLVSTLEAGFLQILNVLSKRAITKLDLTRVQRDYFDSYAKIHISNYGIELWPGYSTSIRQHEKDVLMNVEIRFKLMRAESVLRMLEDAHQNNRINWQQAFQNDILGAIVITNYNNKTYRISDVMWDMTPNSLFESRNGPISYVQYYLERHHIKIMDKTQPLLLSQPTDKDIRGARGRDEEPQPIMLIPELCNPTGYTDAMRKNFKLMQDVAVHTRVGPYERVKRLLDFNRRLTTTPNSEAVLNDWGISVDKSLVRVPARQLKWESIKLGCNRSVDATNASWTQVFQGSNYLNFSESLRDREWAAIIPNSCKPDVDQFISLLRQVARAMDFDVGVPHVYPIPDDRITTINSALEDACNKNVKMIFAAVSNNQSDRYAAIKKVCNVRHAIPCQVVTRRVMDMRNLSKTRSVATKVAIQMATKIGSRPWHVFLPLTNTMFVGYDVCHDTHDKSRSYGALVATMDMQRSARYFSAVSAHQNGEELSNNLSAHMTMAIRKYKEEHGVLPERIMMYRDGVGEGQTNYVYEHELKFLLEKLKEIYDGAEQPMVKLAFIIVSKRINTKFFEERGTGSLNVPAGTVVDDIVTLPERYDFFLVSQNVTQGTATPTNYNVIYDTFGLPPDKLQIMTFKMCHLYYNWAGTTRVPSVCQYAHKLAFLVGNYLHTRPRDELSPFLYFL